MVKKTFRLKQEDSEYLISLASRYRSIRTVIDEEHGQMIVYTTFIGNDEPTSIAASFEMELLSHEKPKMPEHEYKRRVMGSFD